MAMPIGLIYNVKISAKQKAGLVAVFGLTFVMIAFAIIRAKQVLVPQYFVNLTMLMVWSTLAASVCKFACFQIFSPTATRDLADHKCNPLPLAAVVVGSLPALKILLVNRATAKRSRYGSSAGGSGRHTGGRRMEQKSGTNNNVENKPRGKALKMESFSSDKKSTRSRSVGRPETGDSQEEILQQSDVERASSEREMGKSFVLVQRDVVWLPPAHPVPPT